MENEKLQLANRQINNITYLGIIVNIVLAVIKVVIGLLGRSTALFADGIHSISDMITDVAVLLGVHYGSKKPDYEHPYGHGRFETFATGVIAIVLILVGGAMIQKAAVTLAKIQAGTVQPCPAGWLVMSAAVVSIIAKEGLYWLTRSVAVRTGSSALYANAWHHRSDALSSIIVLIGFIALKFGYAYADQIATVGVGLMIILVGVKIIGGCLHELAERRVDNETLHQIEHVISTESRIRGWHKLRTRSVGREIFLDMHVLVDPDLSVVDAHKISDSLEMRMKEHFTCPVNIMVHIEPDLPELRH